MPIVKYLCKLCSSAFDRRVDALLCEKDHLKIKKTLPVRYVKGSYPVTIEVEFEDGKKISYVEENSY